MIMHPTEIAKELMKFPFFRGFPEKSMVAFATMTEAKDFRAGEEILVQGHENDSLYFIRTGIISVSVDGEIISELSESGEVFGEMSVINKRPTSTTIKALTAVQVFRINESHLLTLPGHERFKFHELLYSVYSRVLVERLTKTNDKAKRFEIANRELQSTQGQLQKLNENLESEISRRSSELVKKVFEMTETYINPAKLKISQILQSEPTEVPISEVKSLNNTLTDIVDVLKPVIELGQRQILAKKVLIHDSNKKQINIARLALGGTGVALTTSSNSDELVQHLGSNDFDAILCDAVLVDDVQMIQKIKPNTPLVMIVNMDMKFYLDTIKYNPKQNYFISRSAEDRTFTVKNVSTTVAKLLNNDFFGMEKYLSWGTKTTEVAIDNSDDRIVQTESMLEHFKGFGVRTGVLEKVHTVAEELLMNAIYDAPTDATGKSLFNHKSRTEKIHLARGQEARLKYGTDGMFLAVSVTDPFGSLTKDIIMKYLESCYDGQAGIYNKEKGGAGRGLHMIIESANLTIFNIIPRKKTEVISLFNLEKSDQETPPTFHIFFAQK
jgi:CRP-like cAMP-binding protein